MEREMSKNVKTLLFAVLVVGLCMRANSISAQMPAAIDAPGQTVLATVHAEGAQVYECKADTEGKLIWQLREPIATLFLDGRTVGRHYAGPTWQHREDGDAVFRKPKNDRFEPACQRCRHTETDECAAENERRKFGRHCETCSA
jgi:hypothetical protein